MSKTLKLEDFKANTKEWFLEQLGNMSASQALQTISDLYDELHKPTYPKLMRSVIMEERQYKELRMPLDDDDKLATEVTINGNKILSPNGYLIGKITQVDNGMLVEYVKKQLQYTKTYEECCKILGLKGIKLQKYS